MFLPRNLFLVISISSAFLYVWGVVFQLTLGLMAESWLISPWAIVKNIGMLGLTESHVILSGGISVAFFGVLLLSGYLRQRDQDLFGDAHWASEPDVVVAGLRKSNGIIVGKKSGRYLVYDDNEHLMCFMTTGSGKGVGVVLPNLLNWNDSAVVLDPKNENYKITSGLRKKYGHAVYCWNPVATDFKTHRFNPLDMIRRDALLRISDIQKIANVFWPQSEDKGDPWGPGARSLFLATVLLLLDSGKPVTLGQVLRNSTDHIHFSTEDGVDDSSYVDMLVNVIEHHEALDDVARRGFSAFLLKQNRERSGVLSTLMTKLELWENPLIDAATSTSDFDIRALRSQRMTIYVGVPTDALAEGRIAPLLNLFFQQVVGAMLAAEPDKKDEPYKVLMVLDEFAALGAMPILLNGIGVLRSYQVIMMLFLQDLSQLGVYGKEGKETFLSNCKRKICSANGNMETARFISETLGDKTIRTRSRGFSGGAFFGRENSVSTTQSYTKLALMTPSQIAKLKKNQSIVLSESGVPVLAKKIAYYQDKAFTSRLYPAVDLPQVDIQGFIDSIVSLNTQSADINRFQTRRELPQEKHVDESKKTVNTKPKKSKKARVLSAKVKPTAKSVAKSVSGRSHHDVMSCDEIVAPQQAAQYNEFKQDKHEQKNTEHCDLPSSTPIKKRAIKTAIQTTPAGSTEANLLNAPLDDPAYSSDGIDDESTDWSNIPALKSELTEVEKQSAQAFFSGPD